MMIIVMTVVTMVTMMMEIPIMMMVVLIMVHGSHLLVLKPGLDKVEGEDAGDADDAGNAAVDDLGQERELLLVDLLGGHDGPLLPDGRHG